MAVIKNLVNTSLVLGVKSGIDEKGNDVIKKIAYTSVKIGAADQELADTANALSSLCAYPLDSIQRVDYNLLMNM